MQASPTINSGFSGFIGHYYRSLVDTGRTAASLHQPLDGFRQQLIQRFIVPVVSKLPDVSTRIFPVNWVGVQGVRLSVVLPIVMDEGIPLMWVPRASILQALVAARDARARRSILGRRWKDVATDCEQVLTEIVHDRFASDVILGRQAVASLQGGYAAASQALSANLLDSVLRKHLNASLRKQVTNHKNGNRLDIDSFSARLGLTMAPVWRGYAEYWLDKGDRVPYSFTRHASAHAVSKRQYSRINAVVAIMLISSVLKLLDEQV
ncbi:hypothetical protein [Actinophytocola sp.]|jgi:hypothetical protein|uniref:hypothetical protein n=1 Tax=Actinophytocola sp. TaxID=1872138 RepID=UPI002ED8F3E9